MAIAALVSVPITAPILRSLTSFRSSSSSSFPTSLSVSLRHQLTVKYPSSGILASSMSIQAPVKTSSTSFLDNKESGFLHFAKYHGVGNDFIMFDNRDSFEPRINPEQAVKICDRNFGIGADGVIFVMPGVNGTDYTMRVFNSDGSEPEMCGNGIRCFAKFVLQLENLHGRQSFTIHTGAGLIVPEVFEDGSVKVDMGEPILKASDIPTRLPANKDGAVIKSELDVGGVTWNVTCVSMGNPHCVTFGTKGRQGEAKKQTFSSFDDLLATSDKPVLVDFYATWCGPCRFMVPVLNENLVVDELKLAEIGPKFEHHEMFPARTNTEFVQVLSDLHLKMRVWERGAGATLACGTGACALVVAAVLEGHVGRNCTVDLPGGPLQIEWRKEDNHVHTTGPAELVYYGSLPL